MEERTIHFIYFYCNWRGLIIRTLCQITTLRLDRELYCSLNILAQENHYNGIWDNQYKKQINILRQTQT